MAGSRTLLALVVLLITAAPSGVMGQRCIVNYDSTTVDCPGWRGGDTCPESQTYLVCGSVCDNPPEEEAFYCEDQGKITCMECDDTDAMDLIWVAKTVGSCYC